MSWYGIRTFGDSDHLEEIYGFCLSNNYGLCAMTSSKWFAERQISCGSMLRLNICSSSWINLYSGYKSSDNAKLILAVIVHRPFGNNRSYTRF